MLKELHIKNLILVKEAVVSFKKGLNIITGETGAGKSVIIGSINLLSGERVNGDIIRSGENKCVVEAVIDVSSNHSLIEILSESGIDNEGGELIIKREIQVDGNNKQYINGSPVTLSVLKKIGKNIFDIHGQNDHQSLFDVDSHIQFLDWFAGNTANVKEFSKLYNDYLALKDKLIRMENDLLNNERESKLWQYELNEIEKAELSGFEEENLNKEYNIISKAKDINDKSAGIYEAMYGGDQSVHSIISGILRELIELSGYDGFFKDKVESCQQMIFICEDLADEVRHHGDSVEFNPERLSEIEERIDILERIKRKFNKSIPEIIDYANCLREKLNFEENASDEIGKLKKQCEDYYNILKQKSDEIHNTRESASVSLSGKIIEEFKRLGMNGALFNVLVEKKGAMNAKGSDYVEFMFAGNKGESWSPLKKAASGGEISRIMLALKSMFADADNIDVLVFDEIDVNLGGKVARDVGKRLHGLSTKHQVFCITHLPQIASLGNSHYKVEKKVVGERTLTEIIELDKEQRIDEITRMLGGEDLSSVAKIHAKELIEDDITL